MVIIENQLRAKSISNAWPVALSYYVHSYTYKLWLKVLVPSFKTYTGHSPSIPVLDTFRYVPLSVLQRKFVQYP